MQKNKNTLKDNFLAVLLIGLIIFCLFNIFNNLNNVIVIIGNCLAIVFSFYYFIKFEKERIGWIIKNDSTHKNINQFIGYFFILMLLLIVLGEFFSPSWLKQFQSLIIILAVISGGLTFWLNGEKVEKEIEEENDQEKKEEDERKLNFSEKFPRVNKFPVVRSLIKWMYKEGWWYSLGLFLIVALGFVLRVWDLTILDPYTDEYYHILAAKEYFDFGFLGYMRAKFVTYSVIFFYWLIKPSSLYEFIFWGRIPGVIFGAFTIIFIYFLSKRISKRTGLISSFLLATSPWAIGISRNIREYAFYPFFIILFLFLLEYINSLISQKKKNYLKITLFIIFLFLFLFYIFFVDIFSTFKILGVIIPSLLIYYFFKNINYFKNIYNTNKYIIFLLSLLVTIFFISIIFYGIKTGQVIFINFKFSLIWWEYFFGTSNSPMHWWDGSFFQEYYSLLFIFLALIFIIIKKRYYYFLSIMIFFSLLFFFSCFFNRYIRPRYIFYAFPFFIIIIAPGIEFLILIIRKYRGWVKILVTLIILIFSLKIFNYKNIIYPIISDMHGYVKTTNEYHFNLKKSLEFLKNEIYNNNSIITTNAIGRALKISFNIDEKILNYYMSNDNNRFIFVENIIKNNPQGLMILDSRTNGQWTEGYPKSGQFLIANKKVNVIRNEDDIQIYKW
jgi:hypothetical protein